MQVNRTQVHLAAFPSSTGKKLGFQVIFTSSFRSN